MTYVFEILAGALLLHLALCVFYTKELVEYPFLNRIGKVVKGSILWLLPLLGPIYIWHYLSLGPVANDQADNRFQGEDSHADHS